ncbi:MAG: pyrimidine-nucleoside phosphorylase [Lachnospiraceae bacterium]|nr:pyrimidine-nucleoside phosphorylase [Lachnospiraceae bacterium]
MRMYDIIVKKRSGLALSEKEIRWMIEGYTKGDIPDYQMSAFLMAVYFQGMTDEETAILTDAMAGSGERLDLSSLPGVKADKHSTGGVGDKTTMIVAPIAAACGCTVAKLSGRGLGHTGGTVDKLESIPGTRTALEKEEFLDVVRRTGIAVTGQSGNLAPADKKLYALRDVTATVDSIPLIAASIMSKKLAAGSDCIVLDVKTGSGAFMKTVEDSVQLAQKMVAIGVRNGKKMAALITDMDVPLGYQIGNALEVEEAVHTLKGEGPADLTEVCLALATQMLHLADKGDIDHCRSLARQAIDSGAALQKLAAMIEGQGGDPEYVYHPEKLGRAPFEGVFQAEESGYLAKMDAEGIGVAASLLGAGRETKESTIDPLAGIILHKKTGDAVKKGETIASLLTSEEAKLESAISRFGEAVTIAPASPQKHPLIYARVTAQGVEYMGKKF